MFIEFQNPNTETFHDNECMPEGYVVEVSDNGIANVKKAVGEALIDKYSGISEND